MDHLVDKSYNGNGSIFLDYRNTNNFSDDNNVVYGHFIKSGKLFYDLDKFRKQDFYDKNNSIKLYTFDGEKNYIIYSAYVAEPNENYRMQNFSSSSEKSKFLEKIKSKSMIKTLDVDVENAKILTLSTCSDRGDNRLVIHAVEI